MTTEATPTPDAAAAAAATEAATKAAAAATPGAPLTLEKTDATPAVATTNTPAPAADAGDKVVPVEYNKTGDDGLDMALKFVGDLGYHPEHPAMKAAMEGDFSLLEAELATKGVKGYDAYIKLGQQAFTRTREKTKARQEADRVAVEGAVGGADNWRNIQKWASENATDQERSSVSKMLGAGGFEAQAAAVWLKSHYDRASGVSDEGPGKTVAVVKSTPPNDSALNAREYSAAVAEARRVYKGSSFETSREYKALQARRMAHRG